MTNIIFFPGENAELAVVKNIKSNKIQNDENYNEGDDGYCYIISSFLYKNKYE